MIYLVTNQVSAYDSSLYQLIDTIEAITLLEPLKEIGLDTETEGLDPYTKQLLLLQLGNAEFQVLFDIASFNGKLPPKLRLFMNKYQGTYILQNAKFDAKFLFIQGVILRNVYDTMLAEIILTNGLQYSGRDLATIADKYCNVTLNKEVRGEIIKSGLSDRVLVYGAEDVRYLPEIKRKQLIEIKQLELEQALALDNKFVIVLAYVEFCGIKLDFEKWKKRTQKNINKVIELRQQLNTQLEKDQKWEWFSGMRDLFTGDKECIINWNSPTQVKELFKSYGIKVTYKDKGVEKESIDSKVLDPQKNDFAILPIYLKYKEFAKETSTYGLNWEKYINKVTKRIHTTFQQLMVTGRLSSGNKRDGTVNLQNIPSDEETRSCFIAEEGNVLVDSDYHSQESIVLANFSQEPNLLNFYKKGLQDSHSYVAFLMYPEIRTCSVEEVTKEALQYIKQNHSDKRQMAKSAAFAIAYGGNGDTIAKNCNIPKADGEYVYKAYFEAFPGLKRYFEIMFNRAAHYRFIQFNPVTKRKYLFNYDNDFFALKEEVEDRYFKLTSDDPIGKQKRYNKAKSEIARLAQNYPIQGSSGDITKYAAVLFFKEILARDWWMKVKIVNLVHDEILLECPKEISQEVSEVLVKCMEEAGKPFCQTIPLKAEALVGDHWVH